MPPQGMASMKDWIGCLVSSRTINHHLLSTTNLLHPISDFALYSYGVSKLSYPLQKKVLEAALTSTVVITNMQASGGGDLFL